MCLLDGVVRDLLPLCIHWQVVIRTNRQRDTPPCHRHVRIEFRRVTERTLRLVMIESVDEAKSLIEKLLCLGIVRRHRVVRIAHSRQKSGSRVRRVLVLRETGHRAKQNACKQNAAFHVHCLLRELAEKRLTHSVERARVYHGEKRRCRVVERAKSADSACSTAHFAGVSYFAGGFMADTAVRAGLAEAVRKLWPELEWIRDRNLRDKVAATWVRAFELSPLSPEDLDRIPFTLLIPNCPATFMEHKRCVVHIARRSAEAMQEHLGRSLTIDIDAVIAGAILADVGKLLEYENDGGSTRQSERGELLRHPFTGVALAMECGVPDAVCHIIAAHAAEGDLVKRTTEAIIVHHADFMSYLPFKNVKK